MKKWVLSGLFALSLSGPAWGQGATGVNPLPGSVWTYLGATYGAGWTTPPGFSNAAQPANLFYAGPATGSPAVPTFRPITAADLPPGFGIGGPSVSAVGNVACWNNITGSLLKDCSGAFPPNPTGAALDIAKINVGQYPVAGEIPGATVSGFTVAVSVPETYTEPKWPATAIAAYIENAGPAGNFGGTVALFGQAQQSRNITGVPFGANVIVQNCSWAVSGSCFASGGFSALGWEGFEVNANILKLPGGLVPTGGLFGIKLIGESEVSPSGNGGSVGVALYPLGWTNHIQWDFGFQSYDGAARVCGVCIGALGQQGPSVFSQGLNFVAYNASSVRLSAAMQLDPGGFFNFTAPSGFRMTATGNSTQSAFDVISNGGPWQTAFRTEFGAASTGLALAISPSGAAVPSQGINFQAFDASSASLISAFQLQSNGKMLVLSPPGGSFFHVSGTVVSNAIAFESALAPTANTTGIVALSVRNNAGLSVAPVTLGAADSGGAGFRALRVPN